MRRVNLFGAGMLAALALAGLTAGAAAAAPKGLNLEVGKAPVANGSPAFAGFLVGECIEFSEGTVTVNGKSKDKAAFTKVSSNECVGESLSGMITSAQVTTAGVASFKATLVLTKPGPCLYAIKKFTVSFPVPGEALGSGEAEAKAGKGSSKSCTKSVKLPIEVDLSPEALTPFELALS
jgi:hypothetical protein